MNNFEISNLKSGIVPPTSLIGKAAIGQLLTVVLGALFLSFSALAQSTAFTYQGRLNHADSPATGLYEITFTLYDSATNGNVISTPITVAPVPVTNGLFTATLDFGSGAFNSDARWLEIALTPFGTDQPVVTIVPRQPLTATPYALHAQNAANLMSFGNAPLDIKVNGERALRLEFSTEAPNIIGGSRVNRAAPGVIGAFIGGGTSNVIHGSALYSTIAGGIANTVSNFDGAAHAATIGGGFFNSAKGSHSTIAGGYGNNATGSGTAIAGGIANQSTGLGSTVSGGFENRASADFATVGGGQYNEASGDSHITLGGGLGNVGGGEASTVAGGSANYTGGAFATIGGGQRNWAGGLLGQTIDRYNTIAGGLDNLTMREASTIGGGSHNESSGHASCVPGGERNRAYGDYSFAAGRRAQASGHGAFVWADSHDHDFTSGASNRFSVRATGGVRFFSAINPNTGGATAGVTLTSGSGSWSSVSDHNAKENFTPTEPHEVLDKVAALPIATWNYKSQDKSIRHIGPTAQDFQAAFNVGGSDRTITTIDADGVALAAIQGLNQKLQDELKRRDAENAELKERLAKLEKLFAHFSSSQ